MFEQKINFGRNKKVEDKEVQKEYSKKLNKLMKTIMIKPKEKEKNLKRIIDLLEEMNDKKIITHEQKNHYIKRLHNEMEAPEEFKKWLKNKYGFLKTRIDKIAEKIRRKQEQEVENESRKKD